LVSVANFLKIKGESGSVLTITVLNVNLVGSKDDGFERLWVLTRINGVKTAVGVAYFPNDGIDKPLMDKLFYELFWKTVRFSIQNGMKFASLETLMVVVCVNVNLRTKLFHLKTNRVIME
jgi:hypothetical protein